MSDNSRQQWRRRYLDAAHLFIPPGLRQEAAALARAENVVNAALMAAIAGSGYALAYWLLGLKLAVFEILTCCLIMLMAPPVLRLSGSVLAAREFFLLDGLFVRRLGAAGGVAARRARSYAIAEAIISMAHRLRLSVIAESVETTEQLSGQCAMGCDAAQGYRFARPLPAGEVAALLARQGEASPLVHA